MADVGLGPGATGAVKSPGLIDLEERGCAPDHAHFMDRVPDRAGDGAEAGGGVMIGADVGLGRFDGRARRLAIFGFGHASAPGWKIAQRAGSIRSGWV